MIGAYGPLDGLEFNEGLDQEIEEINVMNDGGADLTVTIVGVTLVDGEYTVHVGPLGSVDDPLCYSGVSGQGSRIVIDSQTFRVILPPLPVGGPYAFTAVDAMGNVFVTEALVVVLPHYFRNRMLSLRRNFPPFWKTGIRFIEREEYPQ